MDTDWITEGARVAEYSSSGWIGLTTVERLTATQVVCANGHRFRRDTGHLVGDHYRSELLPLNDPRVRDAAAADVLNALGYTVDKMCRDHRSGAAGVLTTLTEIERVVADARAAINDDTPTG